MTQSETLWQTIHKIMKMTKSSDWGNRWDHQTQTQETSRPLMDQSLTAKSKKYCEKKRQQQFQLLLPYYTHLLVHEW